MTFWDQVWANAVGTVGAGVLIAVLTAAWNLGRRQVKRRPTFRIAQDEDQGYWFLEWLRRRPAYELAIYLSHNGMSISGPGGESLVGNHLERGSKVVLDFGRAWDRVDVSWADRRRSGAVVRLKEGQDTYYARPEPEDRHPIREWLRRRLA